MNLHFAMCFIAGLTTNTSLAQDFQTLDELQNILITDLVKLDETLSNKGFAFEKTEGLVFKYKSANSKIELQTVPKELSYHFYDRSFFLKVNSELTAENFTLVNAEETITFQNKEIKAAYLKKGGESVYLWISTDEASKKTIYSIKIQQSAETKEPAKQSTKKEENNTPKTVASFLLMPGNKVPKGTSTHDFDGTPPKAFRVHATLATFTFYDPDYGPVSALNLQFGFQKSRYEKMKHTGKRLSDAGFEVEYSVFMGMDYGWRSDPSVPYSAFDEYISLTKHYLGYNQYVSYNIKFADLVLEGGPFLNYNYGVGQTGSAGFMTSGLHLGEHLRKNIGTTEKGYAKMFVGIGFDQYIAFKGGYIGSFGINFGF